MFITQEIIGNNSIYRCPIRMAIFYTQKRRNGGNYALEVKINREIRNYTESMFFGLSLRQFLFSVLGCAVAVLLYFLVSPYAGTETVSWVCMLGAAPFAALGFITYNGMTAEKFIWAWLKSEMIEPKQVVFRSEPTYYKALKENIEKKEKEVFERYD